MKWIYFTAPLFLMAMLIPVTVIAEAGNESATETVKPDIVIDLSALTLYLENNGKTYPIGAGKLDNHKMSFTPVGRFTVLEKNPHPVCTIPGYTKTTYGTRFLLLNAMGRYKLRRLGIHGTDDPPSIGTYVTSGCIRMRNEDIEEIYPLVAHNASVEIK